MSKEKEIRFAGKEINFSSKYQEILNAVLQLEFGYSTQHLKEIFKSISISAEEAEVLESVLNLNNIRENELFYILRYFFEIDLLNPLSEELLKDIAQGCLRYNNYLEKINNKQNIDYTHRIVGNGRPDFRVNDIFYKVITDKEAINNPKEREKMIYRLVFHSILLKQEITEYRIYDLNRDIEYRVLDANIDDGVKNHIKVLVGIYEKRHSYKAQIYSRNIKETYIDTPGVEINYKYVCPCQKGFFAVEEIYKNMDLEDTKTKSPTRENVEYLCIECARKYVINISNGAKNFFLTTQKDELEIF